MHNHLTLCKQMIGVKVAHFAGAVEYTDCISTVGKTPQRVS